MPCFLPWPTSALIKRGNERNSRRASRTEAKGAFNLASSKFHQLFWICFLQTVPMTPLDWKMKSFLSAYGRETQFHHKLPNLHPLCTLPTSDSVFAFALKMASWIKNRSSYLSITILWKLLFMVLICTCYKKTPVLANKIPSATLYFELFNVTRLKVHAIKILSIKC